MLQAQQLLCPRFVYGEDLLLNAEFRQASGDIHVADHVVIGVVDRKKTGAFVLVVGHLALVVQPGQDASNHHGFIGNDGIFDFVTLCCGQVTGPHDHVVRQVTGTCKNLVIAVAVLLLATVIFNPGGDFHTNRGCITANEAGMLKVLLCVNNLDVLHRVEAMIHQHLHRAEMTGGRSRVGEGNGLALEVGYAVNAVSVLHDDAAIVVRARKTNHGFGVGKLVDGDIFSRTSDGEVQLLRAKRFSGGGLAGDREELEAVSCGLFEGLLEWPPLGDQRIHALNIGNSDFVIFGDSGSGYASGEYNGEHC